MGYQLQRLRELIERYPEKAGSLILHVNSLEQSIESLPLTCLANVRTMFEAAQSSIAGVLRIEYGDDDNFPQKTKKIIKALDLSLAGHPDADKIDEQLKVLLGSMNGAASALATLSNIPNLRHGGALDLPTLERQHAYMLGGLCDALVSFLLDVAWSRPVPEAAEDNRIFYEAEADFNDSIDGEYPLIEIAGSAFAPSVVLFRLDQTQYEAAHAEWLLASAEDDLQEQAA